MHSRRLAALLIGAWLAASVFMDFAAIQNFHSVDRVLNAPDASTADRIRAIGGKSEARIMLRHQAGETNAYLFEQWEYAELAIGVALVMSFVFGHGEAPKVALLLAASMLVIVLADRFYLTPEITRLGRLQENGAGDASHFWALHGVYSGLELLKIGLGLGAAGALVIRWTDRGKFVREHKKLARSRPAGSAPTGTV